MDPAFFTVRTPRARTHQQLVRSSSWHACMNEPACMNRHAYWLLLLAGCCWWLLLLLLLLLPATCQPDLFDPKLTRHCLLGFSKTAFFGMGWHGLRLY
jgi:hypothetical protein